LIHDVSVASLNSGLRVRASLVECLEFSVGCHLSDLIVCIEEHLSFFEGQVKINLPGAVKVVNGDVLTKECKNLMLNFVFVV